MKVNDHSDTHTVVLISHVIVFIVIQVRAVTKWNPSKCQMDSGAYPSWVSQNADSLESTSFFHNTKTLLKF